MGSPLSRKVRYVLGASNLADRISRHFNDEISWSQLLQLAGLKETQVAQAPVVSAAAAPAELIVDVVAPSNLSMQVTYIPSKLHEKEKVPLRRILCMKFIFYSLFNSTQTTEVRESSHIEALESNGTVSSVAPATVRSLVPEAVVVAPVLETTVATTLAPATSPSRSDKLGAPISSPMPETKSSPLPTARSASPPREAPSGPAEHRAQSYRLDPASAARSIFASIDRNGDGVVSHIELIKALRSKPQLAKVIIISYQ